MKKTVLILVCTTTVTINSNAQSWGDILGNILGTSSSSSPKSTNTSTQKPSAPTTTTPGSSASRPGAGTSTPTSSSTQQTGTGNTNLGGILGTVVGAATNSASKGGASFTETEAANAIKQALTKGITNGVNVVSLTNGYYGNNLIKIPFPKEVQTVATTLQSIGAGSLVDKLVLQMNRSAEGAAKEALPIFSNAITQMTITDAINIVSNKQQDAATQFLKRATYTPLKAAFRPKIKAALDKTGTPAIWTKITSTYNKVPFVSPVNTDLTDYVTGKALDGLFIVVGQQEAKIRKDPAAQTTSLLQKVFGGLLR